MIDTNLSIEGFLILDINENIMAIHNMSNIPFVENHISVIGNPLSALFEPAFYQFIHSKIEEFKTNDLPFLKEHLYKKEDNPVLIEIGRLETGSHGGYFIKFRPWRLKNEDHILNSIIDASNGYCFALSMDLKYLYFNKKHANFLSKFYEKPPVIGESALPHFQNLENFQEAKMDMDKALSGKTFEVVRKYGLNPMFLSYKFSPMLNQETGKQEGIIVYARRKYKEPEKTKQLLERKETFELLADNMMDMLALHEMDGTYLFISNSVKNLLGYEPEELIGKSPYTQFHPNDLKRIMEDSHKTANSGEIVNSIEYRIKTKSGEYIWFDTKTKPILDENGKVTHLQTISTDVTEKVKARRALKLSEAKFRSYIENASDLIFSLNKEGIVQYISPNVTATLGYLPEELLKRSFLEFIHEENLPEAKEKLEKVYTTKGYQATLEYQIKHKNGTWRWHQARSTYNKLDQDQAFIMGIARDITQQVEDKENLVKSEEKYRKLFESMIQGVMYHDSKGKIISANPAAEKILGTTLSQMQGYEPMDPKWKTIHEDGTIYPPENHPAVMALKNGKEVKKKIMGVLNPNKNKFIWISIDAIPIFKEGEKKPYKAFTTFEDITLQKLTAKKLSDIANRLKLATSGTGIGIWELDLVTKELIADENIYKLLYRKKLSKTYYLKDWIRMVHPDDIKAIREEFDLNSPQKGKYQVDYRVIWSNGNIKHHTTTGILLKNGRGVPEKLIGITYDITSRKINEAKILTLNRELNEINQKKDRLLSIIAHDLRSPFNSSFAFLNVLLSRFDGFTQEEIQKYLSLLQKNFKKTFTLLDQLLVWSRNQFDKIEVNPIELKILAVFNKVLSLFSEQIQAKKLIVKMDIAPEVTVIADQDMVNTVIRNLLSNAIKFSFIYGEVNISATLEKNMVKFSVGDNGTGIPPEKSNKLFKKGHFHTTSGTEGEKGSGLGLEICKDFIEKNGGEIWVESEEKKGTTFFFTLPAK
ncbi:PAS domain-containing sensor histidine kinase [Flexithrix dorotheae]|uniref:PAS domain-containing sensor histidine kinase n=1 Tax=Flexithrix dorotheae TaxID=70993 RepID=UPI000381AC7C|nr:PAS domain-containing sensor histidine kinase [Flexithrix dorotheae]